MARSIVSPHDQRATFVELFFDLVFVFGITQVVGLLHHHLDWVGAGQAVLVFWLVWWAWTQFTWALNAADTTHPAVELGTLVATAVAFFMAIAIPDAFAGRALWFALPYVAVRVLGLGLYIWVASSDRAHRQAVATFALVSSGGLIAAILGGVAGGTTQYYLWGLTIVLDVVAAAIGGSSGEWNLHPEHFAERHGLIVIIALGESLIVAAGGATGSGLAGPVLAVAVLGVLTTCVLWWTYFPVAKPELEEALSRAEGARQAGVARDAYSLAHFPMVCGIIAFAVALEEAVRHPGEPLSTATRLALALGLLLFVGGTALAMWRATCGRPIRRVVIIAVTGAVVFFMGDVPSAASLGAALAGVLLVAALDEINAARVSLA
ncbi:MAG: low temperature requirement protein A [Gemmatimonadota bacterium]